VGETDRQTDGKTDRERAREDEREREREGEREAGRETEREEKEEDQSEAVATSNNDKAVVEDIQEFDVILLLSRLSVLLLRPLSLLLNAPPPMLNKRLSCRLVATRTLATTCIRICPTLT
jgi:hypothetical protein